MDKGSIFERDGQQYEVLQKDLGYVKKNKSACIRPQGGSKSVTIEQAIEETLIRKVDLKESGPSKETTGEIFTYAKNDVPKSPEIREKNSESLGAQYIPPTKSQAINGNVFFLPVDQLRAQVFLAHGLIYPGAYDKAAASSNFDDIQKHYPSELTLFTVPPQIRNNQLIMRIAVHPGEINDCDRTSNVLRLSMPLPISRIISIDVSPEAGDLSRFIDGWIKPDVPVPRHIFRRAESAPTGVTEEGFQETSRNSAKQIPGVEESIRKFDRYMGLMVFLRNAARYFSDKTGCYSDYPEEFFSLCSLLMQEEVIATSQRLGATSVLFALLGFDAQLTPAAKVILSIAVAPDAYIEKDKARSIAMEIYKDSGENADILQAFKTLFSGDYRSAIQVLQRPSLPPEAALLAALFKFSGRQSNDHRTVKQRLHEDWKSPEQVLPVLGILGAYYGYTLLDAAETNLYSVHPLIRPFVEERPKIKFHLQTAFERQVIESIYQWAFYRHATDNTIKNLVADISVCAPAAPEKPRSVFIRDKTFTVRDLLVRRYEVTYIGRIIQRLKDMKGDSIDERSEVGRCLLYQCFFFADEYELSRRAGRETLRYRISKQRLVDLIVEGRITINPRVLETAIDEDTKNSRT